MTGRDNNLEAVFNEVIGEKQYITMNSCTIEVPAPFCLTVFGASGDLTQRKIIPALYKLDRDNLFPGDFVILGTARTKMSNSTFRALMKDAVKTAFPDKFD